MEANILIASDTHESSDSRRDHRRWFPGYISNWPPDRQLAYLHSWDDLTSRALGHLITRAKQFGPFSSALFLGDLTSGDHEEGLLTRDAQEQCQSLLTYLDVNLFGVERHSVHGGHDDGFNRQRNLPTVLAGFQKAQKFLGPPWQSIRIGNFTILCMDSEIFKAAMRFPNSPLRQMALDQLGFLTDELRRASGNVVLAIHDPRALNQIANLLKLYSDKIVLTLAGHFHLKFFNYPLWLVPLFRYIKLHIVPSPWGLATPWGPIGQGGFCTLTLQGDDFALNYHRL